VDGRVERDLRWFIGLSLVAGGFVLLAGAVQFGTLAGAPGWVSPLAAALSLVLVVFTMWEEPGPRSPITPAAAWIAVVLGAMLWAHVDSAGHAFLSGFASIVAVATGIGVLRRHLWAWPVAFASVVGFGPIVLLLASLPVSIVAAGFLLFVVDAVGLLLIHRTYFATRP
jgi:hypothetical protein